MIINFILYGFHTHTKKVTNCYDTAPHIEENGTLTKCEWTLGYVV